MAKHASHGWHLLLYKQPPSQTGLAGGALFYISPTRALFWTWFSAWLCHSKRVLLQVRSTTQASGAAAGREPCAAVHWGDERRRF